MDGPDPIQLGDNFWLFAVRVRSCTQGHRATRRHHKHKGVWSTKVKPPWQKGNCFESTVQEFLVPSQNWSKREGWGPRATYAYIYIYIYTRFAYGALRRLWSQTKCSSKQRSDCEGTIGSDCEVISKAGQPKAMISKWFQRLDSPKLYTYIYILVN